MIALIHDKPEAIPSGKSESDPDLRKKLDAFREKAKEGRVGRFWNVAEQLSGLVATSLQKTIKTYPAVGWVRANLVATKDVLSEINTLRQEKESLRGELKGLKAQPVISNLAALDEHVTLRLKANRLETPYGGGPRRVYSEWSITQSWGQLF